MTTRAIQTALVVAAVGGFGLGLAPVADLGGQILALVSRHAVPTLSADLLILGGAVAVRRRSLYVLTAVFLGAALAGIVFPPGGTPAAPILRALPLLHAAVFTTILLRLGRDRLRHVTAVLPAPTAAELEAQGRLGMASRLHARQGNLARAAELAARAGEWARAADLYRRLDSCEQAGDAYYRAGQPRAAAEMYETAHLYRAAARAREEAGEIERAAHLYEQVGDALSAVRVREAHGLVISGDLYHRTGRMRDAVIAWQHEGQWERAALCLERDFHAPARAALVCVNAGAWIRAGRLYESAGELESACQAYARSSEGWIDAARLHLQLGRPEMAARILGSHVPQPEEPARALVRARLYASLGAWGDALRVLQRLAQEPGAAAEVYVLLGQAFLHKKLLGLAEPHLQTALQMTLPLPARLEACYTLARVLEQRGRIAEARERFQDVLGIDADYRDAEKRYRRLAAFPPGVVSFLVEPAP
jgi:tetratricopeptide (TPR) repeat protein